MLIFAALFRVVDGLPLAATTDVEQTVRMKECQKYIKLISRKLASFPDRCTLSLEGFNIHFISTQFVTCLALTEDTYPTVLTFCCLGEIQREFLVTYDTERVASTRRPYAFIDIGNFLHKTKQRYNNPRNLTTRVNISDLSQEIKLRPPYQITEEDLGASNGMSMVRNGEPGTSAYKIPTNLKTSLKLVPASWYHLLSIAVNIFCAMLNIFRGMSIIGHGHFDEEEDWGAYRYGFTFLAAAMFCVIQAFLILYHTRWQQQWTVLAFLLRTSCLVYLSHFRDIMQVFFHMFSNLVITLLIYGRETEGKLPNYNV